MDRHIILRYLELGAKNQCLWFEAERLGFDLLVQTTQNSTNTSATAVGD
jgi:hypothetical protein